MLKLTWHRDCNDPWAPESNVHAITCRLLCLCREPEPLHLVPSGSLRDHATMCVAMYQHVDILQGGSWQVEMPIGDGVLHMTTM